MELRIKSILFLILITFSFCVACNTAIFYHPTRLEYFDPGMMGFRYQEQWVRSTDGTRLHGLFIPRSTSSSPQQTLILFFHGNGENVSSHFIAVAWLADRGYDILTYDYRGYGKSEGETDHSAIQDDVLSMLEAGGERARLAGMKFVVYGQSLGGILSARGIRHWKSRPSYHPPDLLILDSTFASYRSIAASRMSGCLTPFVFMPYLLLSDEYAVRDSLKSLSPVPVLVVHGDRDEIVPVDYGKDLYEAAGNPKRLLIVEGASHVAWAGLGRSPAAEDFLRIMRSMMKPDPQRSSD